MIHSDEQFMKYIAALEPILAEHGENSKQLQAYQVNRLVKLEKDFRKALVRHPRGIEAYREFIYRCKNILTARPYFRERDETFKASISKALKEKNPQALARFNINRMFIDFILKLGWWLDECSTAAWAIGVNLEANTFGFPDVVDRKALARAKREGKKLFAIAEEHRRLRAELIECNLPFAISQARTFYGRNQNSHLAYMDFNQIGAIGLMNAIDKFTGPWTETFRNVAIGRMKGDFIEENSQTFVHFYPQERKVLYRVRKILRTLPQDGQVDWGQVHSRLNQQEAAAGDKLTKMSDMLHIWSASQVVQANSLVPEDEEDQGDNIDKYPDDVENRPDAIMERQETRRAVANAIKTLSLVDQKLLRMRGIEVFA